MNCLVMKAMALAFAAIMLVPLPVAGRFVARVRPR